MIAVPDFYAICQSIWQELLYRAKSAAANDDSGVYDGDLSSNEQFIYFCVVMEAGIAQTSAPGKDGAGIIPPKGTRPYRCFC